MRPAPSPGLSVRRLEDRSVPALFTVTNLMDNGNDAAPVAGSLRAAIEQADSTPGADDIVFAAGLTGTINLQNNGSYGGTLNLNSDLTVTGPDTGKAGGGITVNGSGTGGVIASGATAYGGSPFNITLANLTVTGGNATPYGSGGGIAAGSSFGGVNMTLNRVLVTGNTASNGGGVALQFAFSGPPGSLTVNESEVRGNSAVGFTFSSPSGMFTSGGYGGGLNVFGNVTINRSTIAGNTAVAGGGLYASGSSTAGNALAVTNTTFDGNTASGYGGAVLRQFGGTSDVTTFEAVTAVRNSSGVALVASYGGAVAPVSVRNSVVAENSGGNLSGAFTDSGGNVFGSTTGATFSGGNPASTITGVASAGLAALADNGGPTRTALPLSGSPALGRGLAGGTTPATDQRGTTRPAAGPIDAGAVQVSGQGRLTAVAAGGGGGAVVNVFNPDGTLRFTINENQTFGSAFRGGARVAVGDLTGDGTDDIVVVAGQGGGPVVLVFDGNTGQELKRFELTRLGGVDQRSGFFVAVGNVQGSATPEIVVTPGSSAGPIVDILDYNTGAETAFFAFDPTFRGGLRVAVGDVDFAADGYAEIVVTPGPGGGPVVRVFNPRALQFVPAGTEQMAVPVREFMGLDDPNFRGGAFVAVVSVASQRSAVIAVTRDSFPNTAGSFLEDSLFDQNGQLPPQPLGPDQLARDNSQLAVNLFTFNGLPGSFRAAQPVLIPSPTGARVAFGVRGGQPGLFVGAGPQNRARVQFLTLDVATGVVSPVAQDVRTEFGVQDFSVYVGAGAPVL